MEPISALIGGASLVLGRVLGPGGALGAAPGGPAISSAMSGGTMASPFNVGSGVGSPSQIGAIGQFAPWIVIGVIAWALLKK